MQEEEEEQIRKQREQEKLKQDLMNLAVSLSVSKNQLEQKQLKQEEEQKKLQQEKVKQDNLKQKLIALALGLAIKNNDKQNEQMQRVEMNEEEKEELDKQQEDYKLPLAIPTSNAKNNDSPISPPKKIKKNDINKLLAAITTLLVKRHIQPKNNRFPGSLSQFNKKGPTGLSTTYSTGPTGAADPTGLDTTDSTGPTGEDSNGFIVPTNTLPENTDEKDPIHSDSDRDDPLQERNEMKNSDSDSDSDRDSDTSRPEYKKELKGDKTIDEHLHATCKTHFDETFKNEETNLEKKEYAYVSHDNEYCYGIETQYERDNEDEPFIEKYINNVKCPITPEYKKGTDKSNYKVEECKKE